MAELFQLAQKSASKMFAMCDGKSPVTKSVVTALKSNDSLFAGGQVCGFQGGFHGFESGITKDGFAFETGSLGVRWCV